MSQLHEVPGLDRRKQVRLRLRPGLVITHQQNGSQKCFVVKDPINLRYFHLEENQRYLVELMDGSHSLADIQKAYDEKFRPERLSLEELEAFSSQLLESGLVQNESALAGKLLYQRAIRQQKQTLWRTLLNVLCYRVPLWNPDRLLSSLVGLGKIFFHPWCLVLGLLVFLGALGLVVARRENLLLELPSLREFFSFKSMLLFWCLLGVVKILHELGHGLCCKTMGGNVTGLGILFLVFFPTLYCNVSDSWTLPSKWKRMAIGAAGIYVELWIASLAVFSWCLTDSGTVLHHVSLALLLVCSVNTVLCNGNPLMRFDGYFVLGDWLEVPNLALQATRFMQTFALRCLGVQVPWEQPQGKVGRKFLVVFGLASFVYRWLMLAFTLYLVHSFFQAHGLGLFGLLVIGLGLGGTLTGHAYEWARALKRRGRFPEMKRARFYLASGVALSLGLAFFLLPLPYKVHGIALIQVEPEYAQRLIVTEGGFLQELLVEDGQRVKAGEILALLTNPKLEIKLRVNEAEQILRNQEQKNLVAMLTDADLQDQRAGDNWSQNYFERKSLAQSQRALKKQLERLELRAPCDGIVQGLESKENKGKWLEKGSELCKVGNDRLLRALVLVEPADQKLIAADSTAKIRVHGGGSQVYAGAVSGIAQVDAKNIPPQLSHRAGGNVVTEQDPVSKAEKPHFQHYLVALRFQEGDPRLHPGVLGSVKIDTEPRTLWWRCRQFLGSTFSWGL